MSNLEIIIRFVSGLSLIIINALFVLTEFGLTRLRQFDRDEIATDARLERGWKMTEELEIYLTSCQLGISATSVILGVVFEPAVTALLEPLISVLGFSGDTVSTISIVVGLIIINLVHQVWGEQAPTYFGVEKPLKAIKIGSDILYWWTKGLYPLIIFGDWLAKATLRLFGIKMTRSWVDEESEEHQENSEDKTSGSGARSSVRSSMVDLLRKKSDLSEERAEEIIKSYDIGNKAASDIMVMIDQVVKLYQDDTISDIILKIENGNHSRYPLYSENKDYIGNIYLPSLFCHYEMLKNGEKKLIDVSQDPMTRDQEIKISELIDAFQDEDQELCILTKDGQPTGLVTFTDACEAVFGQLEDPLD